VPSEEVRKHWEELAARHGTALAATTKTETIKRLEIAALARALTTAGVGAGRGSVLEVGCGNGRNCFALAQLLPECRFTGIDYVPQMIDSANELLAESGQEDRVRFLTADALDLVGATALDDSYDVTFTDRCLINLDSPELQIQAIDQLIAKTRPGGHVVILENFVAGHERQNALREAVGLSRRERASYNLFMDDAEVLRHVEGQLDLVNVDDFGSLHDLVLYVLGPLTNNGEVDYDDPHVAAATELSLSAPAGLRDVGRFGQNRLLLFRRPADVTPTPTAPAQKGKPFRTIGLLARPAGLAVLQHSLLRNPDIDLVAVATHRFNPVSEDPLRGERPEYGAFHAICAAHGIPLISIDDVATGRDLDVLDGYTPFDLLCSVSWRFIVSPRALALARVAAINLHRGKLPEYPGAEPVRRMIEDGEREAVITAHVMVEEVDAGEILATAAAPIRALEGRSSHELAEVVKEELVALFPPLMNEAIRAVATRASA
jgi:predicted O-methyltransferase YrrM